MAWGPLLMLFRRETECSAHYCEARKQYLLLLPSPPPTGVRIRLVLPTLEVTQRYLHCTLSLRKRKGREKTKSGVRYFLLSWGTNLDLGSLTNPPWWKKGERNWRQSLGVPSWG